MKLSFWQQFAINTGLTAFQALIATGRLSPEQKLLASSVVANGQALLATFGK